MTVESNWSLLQREPDVEHRGAVAVEDAEVLLVLLHGLPVLVEQVEQQQHLHRIVRPHRGADPLLVRRCLLGRGGSIPRGRPPRPRPHHRNVGESQLLQRRHEGVHGGVEQVGVGLVDDEEDVVLRPP